MIDADGSMTARSTYLLYRTELNGVIAVESDLHQDSHRIVLTDTGHGLKPRGTIVDEDDR